ncbi:MAG: glycoside hydrolase family 97 catalytic domain-containing protein, partial [Muribaculaceae bacterium]|nr:glycoside hydrolase family 97 catalytic domain-containing protein [Muribaculaceae bacterium]
SLPTIKRSNVSHRAVTAVVPFTKAGKRVFDLELHLSDNNVAMRYRVYRSGDNQCARVERETTGFSLPDGTTTFLCPYSKALTGWMETFPSYETHYQPDAPTGRNGEGAGYTFPCLFHVPGDGWVLISETGVDGSYCASHIEASGDNAYCIAFPQQEEIHGVGSAQPGIALPSATPWRTITVGNSLKPIVETTIPFDVVEPRCSSSKPFTYGRGTWSWIIGINAASEYDVQRAYIDFAAAMGYESVLIDACWDESIGYKRVEELARYAAGKGVGLFLWYNSNGYWNGGKGGPYNKMHRSAARRAEMAWLRDAGIRGIKVDYFGGDKQLMMQIYEDILSDACDYGIEVILHGCTLPRGWERMYPCYVSSEAVSASENLRFRQNECDDEAFNATFLPFLRNAVGSMDFGGSTLNRRYSPSPDRGTTRRTSDVFALATAVLFQSPVQHFALTPSCLTDAPAWAVDFMKQVPSTWDEICFIDGYPGRYVVIARRSGDKWYIAGINGTKETLQLTISLPMLAAGAQLQLYSDDAALNGGVTTAKTTKKGTLKVEMPVNGAFVAVTSR